MQSERSSIFSRVSLGRFLPAVLVLAVCAFVLAQYQVNRQMNVGGGPPSVRYASSPYAGQQSVYTQRVNQSASAMLPSQQRYATWRSGALPSEVRMNAAAVGPLSPSGSIAYLPQNPTPYRPPTGQMTTGNMVNAQAARPTGAMPGIAAPSAGSVKYAPGPVYKSGLSSVPASELARKSGVPEGQAVYGQTMTGSLHYAK